MSPLYNKGRRLARMNYISSTHGKNTDTVFTDAAINHHEISSAIVVDSRGKQTSVTFS